MGSDCGSKVDADADGVPDNGECDVYSEINLGTPERDPATSRCTPTKAERCVLSASITGYKTWGGADTPDFYVDSIPTNPKAETTHFGACNGSTGDDFIVSAGASDPDAATWYASSYETSGGAVPPESADLGTFDDCGGGVGSCAGSDACDGDYNASISVTPESLDCNDYGDLSLRLQTLLAEGREAGGGGRYAEASECVSGSGRFQLAPFWKYDRNEDGLYSAIFLPLQESGTGVMTNRAWVTAATLVSGVAGKPLRLAKRDQTVSFDLNDDLDNPAATGPIISGSHSFNTGVYIGNPYFIAEHLDDGEGAGYEVDLSWTCGAGGTPVDLGQGWQLRPEDIGCGSSYLQKMTLRYFTSPNRVEVQQYGNPNYTIVEPTTTTVDGEAFVFERWGVTVDATLLGLPICTSGTYTLALE